MWNSRVCNPRIRTVIGIIGECAPIRPAIPAFLSCSKEPTTSPMLAILNEEYWEERTVTMSAVAIGTPVGPMPRKG